MICLSTLVMYWNMGGSILYLFALAYAALSGFAITGKH
jgi:hypothetical protein